MQTVPLELDQQHARELYRAYLKDCHYDTPIDKEIRRTYRALAQGKTVIKALESVAAAGVFPSGLPKLGLVRADQTHLICDREKDGSFRFYPRGHAWGRQPKGVVFSWPAGTLPPGSDPSRIVVGGGYWLDYEAVVPIIPLHLRPRRALASYHILFEAEWSRTVPKDPFLLRRLGAGDLWLVVAAWDLTEVERAALSTRVFPN
jgi:hypothetical protein